MLWGNPMIVRAIQTLVLMLPLNTVSIHTGSLIFARLYKKDSVDAIYIPNSESLQPVPII